MSKKITENYNGVQLQQYTKKQKEFLKKAIDINKSGELFCFADFNMTNVNFRQKIFELKDSIECVMNSRPSYYKVKSIPYSGKKLDHITLGGMEVGKKMQRQLESLHKQPPAIHDIKLKLWCPELYNYCVNMGEKPNSKNKGIPYQKIQVNDHTVIRITIYPKTTVIDIGCTYKPIIYDPEGSLELVKNLERVKATLELESNFTVKTIPDVLDWTITQYHFNKDSIEEFSGPRFHTTIKELAIGFVRHYTKKFPDGKTRIRSEKITSPKISVRDELGKMNRT